MGTYLGLSIIPRNISGVEWEQVYDESLKLIQAYPFAMMKERKVFGSKVIVYAPAAETAGHERHWQIDGDLQSKQFSETFRLYRDIRYYPKGQPILDRRKQEQTDQSDTKRDHADILLTDEQCQCAVFDSKTQGYAHHLYLLAIAMLIESRLPGKALVGGDIDYEQCVRAKQWADPYLASPLTIPARVDAKQIFARVAHMQDDMERVGFLQEHFIGDSEDCMKAVKNSVTEQTFLDWLSHQFKAYSTPDQLGALKWQVSYLNTVADMPQLFFILHHYENGPQFPFTEVVYAIARTWVCLPRESFDFLSVFAKVPGHPVIVERQFGTMFLDMKFPGREIQTHIPLPEVVEILIKDMPDAREAVQSVITTVMRNAKKQLDEFRKNIQFVLDFVEDHDEAYADEDAFLLVDNETVCLTPDQEFHLKIFAYGVNKFFAKADRASLLEKPLDQLKKILIQKAFQKLRMHWTEETLDRILALEDELTIKILLIQCLMDQQDATMTFEKSRSDFRRAMFENELLAVKIKTYMKDQVSMKEVEKELSKHG